MSRIFFVLGGLLGTLAIAAGAFGSHLLKERLSAEFFAIFEVAARYHMYHALALLGAAWACAQWPGPWTTARKADQDAGACPRRSATAGSWSPAVAPPFPLSTLEDRGHSRSQRRWP